MVRRGSWHHARVETVYTRPRIEKLGVRPGARVAVLGVGDPDLPAELAAAGAALTGIEQSPPLDLAFFEADALADLDRLPSVAALIARDGAIWVVSPKGRGATVRDTDVIAAARAAGLVDNKVVGFSPTHTALRLVVPRTRR